MTFFAAVARVRVAAAALVLAAMLVPASMAVAAAAQAGNWLLLAEGAAGQQQLALLDCPSGRVLARAAPGNGIADLAIIGAQRAAVISPDGRLSVFELPSLRRVAQRSGLPADARLAVLPQLLAIGGRATPDSEALRLLDTGTLADLHEYRFDPPVTVADLQAAPARASLLAGLAASGMPAEAWEIAVSPDAPPVLRGLVHDYRMGEAVPLPGQYTPRPIPLDSPSAALLPGPVPYAWLRIDADGRAAVLHLEVRRELVRLPDFGGQWLAAPWLAAPWRRSEQSWGWIVGIRGTPQLYRLESPHWRLSPPLHLPGPLAALAAVAGPGAVAEPRAAAEPTAAEPTAATAAAVAAAVEVDGRVVLGQWDPLTAAFAPVDGGAAAIGSRGEGGEDREGGAGRPGPVSLRPSADRRCLALVAADGRWAAALSR